MLGRQSVQETPRIEQDAEKASVDSVTQARETAPSVPIVTTCRTSDRPRSDLAELAPVAILTEPASISAEDALLSRLRFVPNRRLVTFSLGNPASGTHL